MAVRVTNRRGKEVTLLNPSEKGHKFAAELKNDLRYTNTGDIKANKDGLVLGLSKEQRAYRAGYLDSQKDSAKAWKSKNNKNSKAVVIYKG